ncbi:hypothetical protein SBOR_6289 [Sclerotinia borealis F-4128]|uniref:Uncharacterized protein n=1 Tax=Sclerotinia borealis (strain F-4128) TaxID=1432307 RepID=W9CBY8_SCLBF|nr:hypothetical protein SBOR_6289 [Sclerotinia borealis F-4128]
MASFPPAIPIGEASSLRPAGSRYGAEDHWHQSTSTANIESNQSPICRDAYENADIDMSRGLAASKASTNDVVAPGRYYSSEKFNPQHIPQRPHRREVAFAWHLLTPPTEAALASRVTSGSRTIDTSENQILHTLNERTEYSQARAKRYN